jgi:hypothetical protein
MPAILTSLRVSVRIGLSQQRGTAPAFAVYCVRPPISTILLHVIAGHRRACQAYVTGVQSAPNKIDVIVGEGERLPGHL